MSVRSTRKPTASSADVFTRLRAILENYAARFAVTSDTNRRYCVEGPVGPATLRAWGGTARRSQIPVAWVEIGTSYVSFHLMAIDPVLRGAMSVELEKHMHGKTCFHFTAVDESLFRELEHVTARGIAAFKKAGFVA